MAVDPKALAAIALLGACATPQPRPGPPVAPPRVGVLRALRAINADVVDCYARTRREGVFNLALTVNEGGALTSARVVGDQAGTETASCIEAAALRRLIMPATGDRYSIVYPFVLR